MKKRDLDRRDDEGGANAREWQWTHLKSEEKLEGESNALEEGPDEKDGSPKDSANEDWSEPVKEEAIGGNCLGLGLGFERGRKRGRRRGGGRSSSGNMSSLSASSAKGSKREVEDTVLPLGTFPLIAFLRHRLKLQAMVNPGSTDLRAATSGNAVPSRTHFTAPHLLRNIIYFLSSPFRSELAQQHFEIE